MDQRHTMHVTSGHAEINGASLYYEMAGSGPAIVLIHGFTLDSRMWDAQFEVFARGHTVVRYDVRGFGRSSVPRGLYSNAGDLDALLSHLNIGRAAVCGLSMGGIVACEFTLLDPDRVAALIAVDTGNDSLIKKDDREGRAQWRGFTAVLASLSAAAKSKGVAEAKRIWLEGELFAPERELPAVRSQIEEIVGGYSGWHWLNPSPYVPFRPAPAERFADIQAPTLIVVGERDLPVFHAIAHTMAAEIPGARLAIIPGAGHMSNMDRPEEFNRLMLDFLLKL